MTAVNLLRSSPYVSVGGLIQDDIQPKEKDNLGSGSLKLLKNLRKIKHTHGQMVKMGLTRVPPAIEQLISAYVKLGNFRSLNYARKALEIFLGEGMSTLFMWNSLIRGYFYVSINEEVITLYLQLLEEGIAPDHFAFPFVIRAFAKLRAFNAGLKLFGQGVANEAREVFHQMLSSGMVLDRVTLLAVASECTRLADLNIGRKPDRVTLVTVASAFGYLGALDLAKWVHAFVDKYDIPCDVQLGTELVDMYARCGDPKCSLQVFCRMNVKDVDAWTAAIGSIMMEGNGWGVIQLFDEMI
ncbi:pentatricopeptide repeat-containing protein At3g22690-like [Aristolochia californica]|uniref:pentatricopeptide repeat-containing protein At3g22690-like n=1 Tax=Aristolochia californica TaxID=171875 RepID=UPI0035E25A58